MAYFETKSRKAVDERGVETRLGETVMYSDTVDLDGKRSALRGLSSFTAEDGEQLTPDGSGWYRAIHSGRRFRLID